MMRQERECRQRVPRTWWSCQRRLVADTPSRGRRRGAMPERCTRGGEWSIAWWNWMLNREIEIVRLIFHSSKRCVHSSKRCFENLKNDQRGQKLEQDWCQHIPMVTTMCVVACASFWNLIACAKLEKCCSEKRVVSYHSPDVRTCHPFRKEWLKPYSLTLLLPPPQPADAHHDVVMAQK
jgi:hypothetical protein